MSDSGANHSQSSKSKSKAQVGSSEYSPSSSPSKQRKFRPTEGKLDAETTC